MYIQGANYFGFQSRLSPRKVTSSPEHALLREDNHLFVCREQISNKLQEETFSTFSFYFFFPLSSTSTRTRPSCWLAWRKPTTRSSSSEGSGAECIAPTVGAASSGVRRGGCFISPLSTILQSVISPLVNSGAKHSRHDFNSKAKQGQEMSSRS